MSFKVLITDPVSEEGIKLLTDLKDIEVEVKLELSPADLKKAIKDADAHIIRSGTQVTADIVEAAEKLKVICRAGVGVDNIDIDAATQKGIVVMNVPENP